MNAKSQNINRILKITKHFIKDSHFNHSISKYNESFYNSQLYNLCPKKTPKLLRINFFKGTNTNSTTTLYYSPPSKKKRQLIESRSLSMPMLSNYNSPSETIKIKSPINLNRKKLNRKIFLLSYDSDVHTNKSFQRNMNGSVRIINDLLFSARDDTKFQTLHYEEATIFHDKTQNIRRIKGALNKIMEFYNNYESTFNDISGYFISKSINEKTENEVNFKLTSVIIKITHSINENIHYEFKIPLFLVPVFLYNPCHNLPTLLLSIVTFHNKCSFISFELKETLFKVISSLHSIIKDPYNKENEKTRKYHEFQYTWVTPNDSYKIEIRMPLLTVTFKKTNTIIHKYIENKLLLYLHDNNFMHWTFYIVHYLYSFKNFRIVVDAISSKMSSSHIKYAGKDIVISEKRIKQNDKDDLQLLYFITSEDGENYLLTIHSMLVEITLNNYSINPSKSNCFKSTPRKLQKMLRNSLSNCQKFFFTFRELKPLLIASLHLNILDFLSRFIIINPFTKQIDFNYKELNEFPSQMLNSFSSNHNINQENIKLFPNYIAKVIYPVFSIKAIDEMGFLNGIIKGENGEAVHLKEFEMNFESIQILLGNGNIIDNADLIRKLLFYLEDDFNKTYMLSMDENPKRAFARRFSTYRRKTRTKTSISIGNSSYLGE